MHIPEKIVILIFSILISLTSSDALAQKTRSREKYIEEYKEIAISQMNKTGIPASIILAQACLESGDGQSYLAREANNHFGIKCHGWNGPTIRYDDDKRNECFRKYRNAEESFRDHSDFIVNGSRYGFLFDLDRTNYKGWAKGLKKAGYATHPKYAEMLIRIIEDYELYRFDNSSFGTDGTMPGDSGYQSIESRMDAACDIVAEKAEISRHWLYKYSQRHQIYKNNKAVFIIASEKDSYESLAKEYSFFEREIRKFNDAGKRDQLNAGDIVYLQKKRSRSRRKFKTHQLRGNENLRFIAQKYGIRMEKLLTLNEEEEYRKNGTVYLR